MAVIRFTFAGDQVEFDNGKLGTLEAIEVKKLTGMTIQEWLAGMQQSDAEAIRATVWLALGRAGKRPDVKYREFDFDLLEFMQSMSTDEDDGAAEVEPDPTPARQNRASRRTSKPTAR